MTDKRQGIGADDT